MEGQVKNSKEFGPFFPKDIGVMTVLDLGCAEGYVGESIQKELGASVSLADVVSMNQTDLPYFSLQQGPLPWPSKHFGRGTSLLRIASCKRR